MEHDLAQPTSDHGETSFSSHITNENEVLWAKNWFQTNET